MQIEKGCRSTILLISSLIKEGMSKMLRLVSMRIWIMEIYPRYQTKFVCIAMDRNNLHCY